MSVWPGISPIFVPGDTVVCQSDQVGCWDDASALVISVQPSNSIPDHKVRGSYHAWSYWVLSDNRIVGPFFATELRRV